MFFIFALECWIPFWNMESWDHWSFASWTWPWTERFDLAEMVIPGLVDTNLTYAYKGFIIHKEKIVFNYGIYLNKQIGLKGEAMNLVSPNGVSSVDWVGDSLGVQSQSQLKWHKVRIVTGLWFNNILTCKTFSGLGPVVFLFLKLRRFFHVKNSWCHYFILLYFFFICLLFLQMSILYLYYRWRISFDFSNMRSL